MIKPIMSGLVGLVANVNYHPRTVSVKKSQHSMLGLKADHALRNKILSWNLIESDEADPPRALLMPALIHRLLQ